MRSLLNLSIIIKYFNNQPPIPSFIRRFPQFSQDDGHTQIDVVLELSNILDISEVKNEITIIFTTTLSWKDSRLKYLFLKNVAEKNVINTKVWVPKLTFLNMKELLVHEKGNLNVRKEGEMTTNDRSELVMAETYEGSENTITMIYRYQVKFICGFKDIHLYPFDEEICNLDLLYGGAAPGLVDLRPRRFSLNFKLSCLK